MADSGRPIAFDDRIAPFSLQARQSAIQRSEYTEHLSVGGIVSNPEFVVQAGAGMLSLSESYFQIDTKIKLDNGAELPTTVQGTDFPVRPEMLFPELLWGDVDIAINSTLVSDDNGNTYPWKAFAKMCLTEGEGAGDTAFMGGYDNGAAAPSTLPDVPATNAATQVQGFIAAASENIRRFDTAMVSRGYKKFLVLSNKMVDSEYFFTPSNSSAMALYYKLWTSGAGGNAGNSIMSFAWQPQEGFWQQPSFIPASSDVRVTLHHGPSRLPMRTQTSAAGAPTADTLRASVDWASSQIRLYMKRYYLSPEVREQVSARLLQGPMHYPYTRARVARVNLSSGATNVSESALLQGPRPGVVAVFFLPTDRLSKTADSKVSPWAIDGTQSHFLGTAATNSRAISAAASSIYVQWNEKQVPARQYQTSNRSRPSPRAYEEYRRLCGDAGPLLSYDQWCKYTIYYFDLSQASTGDELVPGAEDGTGSLTVVADILGPIDAAGAAQPEPITMFCVGFGASHVTIDAAGQVRRLMY